MRLTNKKILIKLKRKNLGNTGLLKAVDKLIEDFENHSFSSFEELKNIRNDGEKVHNDGFYFFDIEIHRSMILIEFDDDGEATIIWAGDHKSYESTFKNNKQSIEKWLRSKGYIN